MSQAIPVPSSRLRSGIGHTPERVRRETSLQDRPLFPSTDGAHGKNPPDESGGLFPVGAGKP